MEYLIMKLYEEEKKNEGLKIGFNRFSKTQRKIIIVLSIVMILATIVAFILDCLYPDSFYYLYILALIAFIVPLLFFIDSHDWKINLKQHADEYKKKIELLSSILVNNYSVDSETKIDRLIGMYQKYIDKQNERDRLKYKVIIGLFTALGGILSISFVNLDIIGIGFIVWLKIAFALTSLVCLVSIYVCLSKYFDFTKSKYESMINDLESLKIQKY